LQRVASPIPKVTDNACVNVLPRGEKLVALTETQHQLVVDPGTLAVLGEHAWQDSLGALPGLAHPEFDRARGRWVDVATSFAGRPALIVYEHDVDGRARSVLGRWNPGRIPYVHAFGLSARSAVLIGHPFTVNPLSMLFSNEPYISHFRWDNGAPTRLALMSRADGTVREVDAPTGFVFHVIDCFDDGDDTIIDVLRYPNADVVRSFSRERLASERIALSPAPERWRVRPGRREVESSSLGREGFEFPVIDRSASGAGRRYAWGASAVLDGARSESRVVQVDHRADATAMHYREDSMVFGEPVFVRRPGAVEEGDGVLLAVGSPVGDGGSALVVLDARTLQRLARVSVSAALPLGFHGGFVRARG
jgi:carotenoid cleavage dioxygenase-like enzyme